MKKGPKFILIAVLVLLALIGGGILYVSTQLDTIVAGLIEEHGSAATQTPVQVGGMSISLGDASAGISRLTVASPSGFGTEPAIELGNFAIRIDPQSVTSDTIVLHDVTVSGARLRLFQEGSRNNLRELLNNLSGGASSGESADADSGKKIVIERFALEDARAFVSIPELGEEREVTVPTIVLNDIGRASNGATAAEATRQILEPVLRRTLESAAAGAVRDKAKEKLDEAKDDALKGVLDRLGGDTDDDKTDDDQ